MPAVVECAWASASLPIADSYSGGGSENIEVVLVQVPDLLAPSERGGDAELNGYVEEKPAAAEGGVRSGKLLRVKLL